jgi:hypothetical protein
MIEIYLGETDEQCMKGAYEAGYCAFDRVDKDDLDSPRVAITECGTAKRFWWELEDYLEFQCTEERYRRFQRAAAEEEDMWTCFEAGAYAALDDTGYDVEDDLSMFLDQ